VPNTQDRANVVLLAYRRPEMMLRRCQEVIAWPGLGQLIVSIDGVSRQASDDEKLWRSESLKLAKEFAMSNPGVAVLDHPKNSGLTDHVVRALTAGFENSNAVILLEEDVSITFQGLDFLAQTVDQGTPSASTAYSRATHPVKCGSRKTFFPEQWGVGMNRSFFEAFGRVLKYGKVDSVVVEAHLKKALGKGFPSLRRRAIKYWTTLLQSALQVENHTDAIFHYTAMVCGIHYATPWRSAVVDEGPQDNRGLNPRGKRPLRNLRHSYVGADFCKRCELRNMHAKALLGPYYWYSRLYAHFRGIWPK